MLITNQTAASENHVIAYCKWSFGIPFVSTANGVTCLSLGEIFDATIKMGSVLSASARAETSLANQMLFSKSDAGVKLSTSCGQCKFPSTVLKLEICSVNSSSIFKNPRSSKSLLPSDSNGEIILNHAPKNYILDSTLIYFG